MSVLIKSEPIEVEVTPEYGAHCFLTQEVEIKEEYNCIGLQLDDSIATSAISLNTTQNDLPSSGEEWAINLIPEITDSHGSTNIISSHTLKNDYPASKDEREISLALETSRCPEEFNCHQCNFTTNVKKSLTIHIQGRHRTDKFSCNTKARRGSQSLGEFPCGQCNFTAKKEGYLIKHVRERHGMQKLNCEKCNFATNWVVNLIAHVKMRHGFNEPIRQLSAILPPPAKKKRYRVKKKTNTTENIETYIQQFKCEQCSFSSHWKINLNIHVKKCHTE